MKESKHKVLEMSKKGNEHPLSTKTGLPPGALVYVGAQNKARTQISVMDYDGEGIEEELIEEVKQVYSYKHTPTISWVNIDGLQEVDTIRIVGEYFGLEALLLEDVLNTEQRPKVEVFEDHVFFTLKMLSYDKESNGVSIEQVSFVLGRNYVISFQEYQGDVFEPVRNRLRNSWGNIRYQAADYLVYALIDVVVDNYFIILEALGAEIEAIEDAIHAQSKVSVNFMTRIQNNKRQIQVLKRSIHPLREAIGKLQRNETNLITQSTLKYFDDVRDHTLQVIENTDSYYDMNVGVQDIYLSSLSHRMNQVIQVLTIISTLFIPLTFIVGLYGMNFRFMPELEWRYGYWFVWGIMGVIVISLLAFFRKKGWL